MRIHFYNRLSLYLRSGIPIREALHLIRGSARKEDARYLLDVEEAVLSGRPLSEALNRFPAFETHLVAVGEQSGSLPQNLAYLASLLVRRRVLRRKLLSALIYPCIIVLGSIGVTAFLFLYTFPKILPIFEGLHTSLPFSTRVLIGMSHLVSEHGFVLLLTILVCTSGFLWLTRLPRCRQWLETFIVRVPILRSFVCNYSLSLISRTLSTMLTSGMSFVSALHTIGSHSRLYQNALREVGVHIHEGERLSVAMSRYPHLFPHTFIELIVAGESTGSLSTSLQTCAEICEEELDEHTRTLTTLIEPVLMITMGLLVGFIAMAIITPIYSMTEHMTF